MSLRGAIVSSGVYLCVLFTIPIYQMAIYTLYYTAEGLSAVAGLDAIWDMMGAVLRWSPLAILALGMAWVIASAFAVTPISWRSGRYR
jgi:hypothetical protein